MLIVQKVFSNLSWRIFFFAQKKTCNLSRGVFGHVYGQATAQCDPKKNTKCRNGPQTEELLQSLMM